MWIFSKLVTSGIGFLTSVSTSVYHQLFRDSVTINEIIEKIVIPNLREIDLDMFEDNPIDSIYSKWYWRIWCRKRMAISLIKGLKEKLWRDCNQNFVEPLLIIYFKFKNILKKT